MDEHEITLRRLRMRSMRRGIKEMDLILTHFSLHGLDELGPRDLQLYESLLGENDHDLYQWVTGQGAAPAPYAALIARISRDALSAIGGVARV